MTLSKIAKLANVSVSTASKAFSGSPEVNEETRQLVFRVAKEQGCFKKFYNAKYQKLVIAVIAPEFRSVYYARYLSHIQVCLQKENCELCVSSTDFSPAKEKELIEYYYKNADVDGIIVIDSEKKITIENVEIPIVYINLPEHAGDTCYVRKNTRAPMEQSIAYLLEKGVQDIGFIGEVLTTGKLQMFRDILLENGVTPREDYIITSTGRFATGGYEAMETLFAGKTLPRAIICAYDYMAIGAIRCIYDHGLSVPEDVAILGMDDISEAKFLNPPLASISACTEEICQTAAEMILRCINGDYSDCRKTVDGVFHLRKSFEIN